MISEFPLTWFVLWRNGCCTGVNPSTLLVTLKGQRMFNTSRRAIAWTKDAMKPKPAKTTTTTLRDVWHRSDVGGAGGVGRTAAVAIATVGGAPLKAAL